MAKLNFYHDLRSGKGEFPIKIRISHKKENVYIATGVRIAPENWDGESSLVVSHKNARAFNMVLAAKMSNADSVITKITLAGQINDYSASELKELVENGQLKPKRNKHLFQDYYISCMEKKKTSNTRSSYQQALVNLQKFDPQLAQRSIDDINLDYIERLDAWFQERGVTVNSRSVYYRNIRAVFNDALDDGITTNYPFRRFKIKKTPTKKRNLSVEEIRLLRDYPIVNEFQKKYRDIFMLMFYLRGINAVDLFRMKQSDIRLGRLNYVRAKTGKYYSVKIEPEAKALLEKYRGQDYLIDICDGARDQKEWEAKYKGFLQRMDRGLKKIGPYERKGLGGKKHIKPILPFISQYWCRHSCATIMANMGISFETIAASLGHEYGNPTTNIYIEYNERAVDVANRALIDLINEK